MMTNEEAIEALTSNVVENPELMYEALDMAIKALEQQTRDCKTCKHSNNGECAFTEECHACMWESKYEQQPCEDCYYNDGDVHAECVVCNKAESEDKE